MAASAHNARALELSNVEVRPGLGYRELGQERFDQVLCNVPARIGERAIRHLLEGGRALGAEVRVVVIRDLSPVVESLGLSGLRRVARGSRHDVFALERSAASIDPGDETIYARDETSFMGLSLFRPYDASEDPAHPRLLAVLAESLPRAPPGPGALLPRRLRRPPAAPQVALSASRGDRAGPRPARRRLPAAQRARALLAGCGA